MVISAITIVVWIPTQILIAVDPSDSARNVFGSREFHPDPSVDAMVTPNPVVVRIPSPRIVAHPVPTVRIIVRPVTVGVRLPVVLVNIRHKVPRAGDIDPATMSCQRCVLRKRDIRREIIGIGYDTVWNFLCYDVFVMKNHFIDRVCTLVGHRDLDVVGHVGGNVIAHTEVIGFEIRVV